MSHDRIPLEQSTAPVSAVVMAEEAACGPSSPTCTPALVRAPLICLRGRQRSRQSRFGSASRLNAECVVWP